MATAISSVDRKADSSSSTNSQISDSKQVALGPPAPYLTLQEKTLDKIRGLASLDLSDLQRLINAADKKLEGKRQKKISAGVEPLLSTKDKLIAIPKSLVSEDYIAGTAMIVLANKLKFEIKLIDREFKMKKADLSEFDEKFATGILIGISDDKIHLDIKNVDDPIELGRRFFRAEQITSLFGSERYLAPDLLRSNQRFFGNNPKEEEEISKKKRVPITSYRSSLSSIFREEECDEQLAQMLLSLIRYSKISLKSDVRENAIRKNMVTRQELLERLATRMVVIKPKVGNRPAEKKERVPAKPSRSSLLLKEEYDLIDEIISPLFKDLKYLKSSETLLDHLKALESSTSIEEKTEEISKTRKGPWPKVKEEISMHYSTRAETLQKFSAMTTVRLKSIREVLPKDRSSIRKKDVSLNEINTLIRSRGQDADFKFANEIVLIDPKFENVLSVFAKRKDNAPNSPLLKEESIKALKDRINASPVKDAYIRINTNLPDASEKKASEKKRPNPRLQKTANLWRDAKKVFHRPLKVEKTDDEQEQEDEDFQDPRSEYDEQRNLSDMTYSRAPQAYLSPRQQYNPVWEKKILEAIQSYKQDLHTLERTSGEKGKKPDSKKYNVEKKLLTEKVKNFISEEQDTFEQTERLFEESQHLKDLFSL